MKKQILIFLLIVTFPGILFADSEKDIRTFVQKVYDAWNTLNSQNADPFYAKDADVVFFDAAPFQYKGWQEYKEGAQKYFLDLLATGKLVPNDDLKIKTKGDVAWITLTFNLSGDLKDGKKMNMDLRQTSILEKRKGKWFIVHEHISAPLPM